MAKTDKNRRGGRQKKATNNTRPKPRKVNAVKKAHKPKKAKAQKKKSGEKILIKKIESLVPPKKEPVKKVQPKKKKSKPKKAKQNFSLGPPLYTAKIKVIGAGGGGGNVVTRLAEKISARGAELIAVNTDAQDLEYCIAKKKILIGKNVTRGLGTGMNPDIGRQAAEESRAELMEALKGADLLFLTACFGGGTGSSVLPFLAEMARETGALTVAVVTKPFVFEGVQRMRIAEEAIAKLKDKVDTLIVIPNDKIFSIIKKDTPLVKAFEYIDEVLRSSVQGIAELIAMPGIINLDFSDVRAIMDNAGPALIGVGIGTGQERGVNAVKEILNSPLLEASIDGARGILFGVACNRDLKMTEINEIAKQISTSVDPSAKIIFGAYHDRKLRPGQLKVTLVATGFHSPIVRNSVDAGPTPALFEFNKNGDGGMKFAQQKPSTEWPKAQPVPQKDEKGNNDSAINISKKEAPKEEKPNDDMWEIPAFMRKKKK
ncbi:MAG: cell division protein FtsZ [Candidatus Harrisonbacteria bacterium CG10_big_fil_rev_8_21_14_0_10_40_38]|uniref:Cell division protein FtsZ n=1 Tax=Candidatus Harrisonbacteria bacterium CG10_big_fil_rev_8_21_14_0_10_40_38 TaxID=1974583 RepID=A0A2H0UTY7_9BACT|nr:MAG: cell division protein FtsZ [Candidatus Harrisonbacteria bacterium CG10_big_fil_rev_8_21_14_0_10_40_38]